MTEHAEHDGAPSSESDKGDITVEGPRTEDFPGSLLDTVVDDLTWAQERSQGRAGRRRKRRFSDG